MASLNEIQEIIRSEIENLSSVQASFIYGGQFEENDFDYFKGSVEYGTTCLLVANGGGSQATRNKSTLEKNINFAVFIIGSNDIHDEDKIAASNACNTTLDELEALIINNNFNSHITFTELQEWQNVENTIDKGKRISILMLPFSIQFKTNIAIQNNQLI